jgi:putative flippase GtrA
MVNDHHLQTASKDKTETLARFKKEAGLRYQALRFLVSGGVNTIVTYAIYLAMLRFIDYTPAYTIAFVIGIALAYVLNAVFVFRTDHSLKKAAFFPVIYLIQYGVNVAILHVAVERFSVLPSLALVISIAISLPLTFFLSRYLFTSASTNTDGKTQ